MSLGHGASIVRDGLVLHLDAANVKSYPGSGTTWYDLSGNGNTGTLVNEVGYSSNNQGYLTFDGNNDSIAISNLGLSSHTIEAWVNPQQSVGGISGNDLTNVIGVYTADAGSLGKYTVIAPYGTNTFTFRIDDGSISFREIGSASYSVGQWYHTVITYESSSGFCAAYLNGNSAGTLSATSGIVFDSVPFNIAKSENGTHFNCYIASTKAYNRALSAEEVSQNFEAMRGRYGI